MKTIFAICGSTRNNSVNLQIIQAIKNLLPIEFQLEVYENISNLPHFNPDLDQENPPQEVIHFRKLMEEANGILICTPEYAMGLPGAFKNAIDWTVSSASFSKKPCFAIVASSQGEKAFESLNTILSILEVSPISQLIPFVRSKLNTENEITDKSTLQEVKAYLFKFLNEIEASAII